MRLFVVSFLLIVFVSRVQNGSEKGTAYFLKGKLIKEFEKFTPLCGTVAWATVAEFKIIEFSDETYLEKTIPIIFTCPNSWHDKLFKTGKTYDLILVDENQAGFEWTMLESSNELLAKYDLKKEFYFVRTKK